MVDGTTILRKKLFCNNKISNANSIPIKIREKNTAKSSENPSGYNCLTSKVEIAKYGLGYNLATAEIKNKNEIIILIVHGKYFLKFSNFIFLLFSKIRFDINVSC